jgi:hypothetical protein
MSDPTTAGTGGAMPGEPQPDSRSRPHWDALFAMTTRIATMLPERPDAQTELDTLWRMIYALWRVYDAPQQEAALTLDLDPDVVREPQEGGR